jgi:hypothetical protein
MTLMKSAVLCRVARALAGAAWMVALAAALSATAADLAANYRLTDYRTGTPFRLYDLAGSVVLLDFFSPS